MPIALQGNSMKQENFNETRNGLIQFHSTKSKKTHTYKHAHSKILGPAQTVIPPNDLYEHYIYIIFIAPGVPR